MQPLADIAAQLAPLPVPVPKPVASIVVGSYNRLDSLCELLERFLEQDFSDFEVIVIEQSSRATDIQRQRLRTIARDPRIRIYQRPPLGGAGARNEGCRLARADIIVAFDDDDLPASRSWLRMMLRNFEDPKCLAVSGRHIVEGGANPPYANMERARRRVLSYSPLMWQRCYPKSDRRSEKIQNLMGGNSAFRRSAFERAGLWDTFARCENENSFCFRMRKKMLPGEYLVFDPEATMIRRLGIAGGMGKREMTVFEFGWYMFEYFHKVIGYYHPLRFIALYPIYFVFFHIVMWDDWNAFQHRPVYRFAQLILVGLLQPVLWVTWLARLAYGRVVHGPTKRETKFVPYQSELGWR